MGTTIYVGNISYSMKEDDLLNAFKPYGEVQSVKIITDKRSGRSKGYGFVEMASLDIAEKAVEALNGSEVAGRNIKVNLAHAQKEEDKQGDLLE
jgi:RNA recognition motif-containing protein